MSSETYQTRIQKNNHYYEKFSSNVAARTDKRDYEPWMQSFLTRLPKGDAIAKAPILDIGCGTGIHMRRFHDLGYAVLGVEPSEAMRKIATEAGLEVVEGTFENLDTLPLPQAAGIWCAASLLHVPKEHLQDTLQNIHNLLHDQGALFLTVRIGSNAKWDRFDEHDGEAERFIQLFEENELLQALKATGFHVKESLIEQSYWGRPAPWISLIATRL